MMNHIRTIVLFSLTVAAVAFLCIINALLLDINVFDNVIDSDSIFLVFLKILVAVAVIGSITSVLLSKWIVKLFLNVRSLNILDSSNELRLYHTVKRLSDSVSLTMPQIVIYQGNDINAFATGFRPNHALLAVSQQLLDVMKQDEMEGVVGHEISHISNGDMLSLALMQGVVNTIVYLPANILEYVCRKLGLNNKPYYHVLYYFIISMMQLGLGWIASLIVMWFSRQREFHADRCGAKLAGYECMLRALECLQASKSNALNHSFKFNYSYIFRDSIYRLFVSHPSLSARISALRNLT